MAVKPADSTSARVLQDKPFLLLVVAISVAFAFILWPFYGAIFWATVLAIMFAPLHRWLSRVVRQRSTLAALATVLVILVIVILPAAVIAALLMHEGIGVYQRIQSGELDFGRDLQQMLSALPSWATGLLDRFGLTDLAAVRERVSAGLTKGVQFFAGYAWNVGQNALEFVVSFFIMLYLLFFLLRDGSGLYKRIRAAIPLQEDLQRNLGSKFANVIRATIKGNKLEGQWIGNKTLDFSVSP